MAQSVDVASSQLPLKGVILCCTSLSQDVRNKLSDSAIQMGAVHKLDLTSDVTHLLVGSIITPKYRYVAKDRPDIKVLQPNWIEAVRESWMEGGDVDVGALEMKHKLPAFAGLQICVTGFDNLDQRNYISETIEEQGATYHGDLTKTVTHLIAAAPHGAKYTHAKQWGINIVSLKWFEDSLYRGLALDESPYDPVMPIEEQGKGAFRRQTRPRTSLGKHGREDESQNTGASEAGKKRLRRTTSSRLESQSQDMWQDISTQSVTLDYLESDQWKDDETHATGGDTATKPELLAADSTNTGPNFADLSSGHIEISNGLFAGLYILLQGFETSKATLLRRFLEPNGACIVQNTTELEDASCNALFKDRYLLVPHTAADAPIDRSDFPPSTIIATEWWVERCIHYKRLLHPHEDMLSSPISSVESSGFSSMLVSTTGFAGVDLRQVSEAVKLMGATYQEKVLPSSSVLISGSKAIRKEKAFYASKHRIPMVSADWLWTCLKTRKKVPFEKFTISLPALDPKDFAGEPSTNTPTPDEMQPKRPKEAPKGKDDPLPKRLSSHRSKHNTPSLSLQAEREPRKPTLSRPQTIVHEDDPPPVGSGLLPAPTATSKSPRGSQPLQEVSPNLSPQKTCVHSKDVIEDMSVDAGTRARSRSRTMSPVKPVSSPKLPNSHDDQNTSNGEPQPPARPQHEVTADLAELLNKSVASRPSSAAGSQPLQKRKSRPLGRAPSGISNRSASAQSEQQLPSLAPEVSESAADGFTVTREAPAPPSTQLGYETPEAEAHRLHMSKKMGSKLQDDSGLKRVASLGTVKDTALSADAGVGNRVRAKHNRTK